VEFSSKWHVFWGLLGFIGWSLRYYSFMRVPQIYIPQSRRKNHGGLLRSLLFILALMAWVSVSVALMGPRKPLGFAKNKIEVNDIFFVVDVSRSMLANDFEPNRLEAAKVKIAEFVNLRPKDRIGIIMFSEKAFTLLPLSTDLELISQIISEIRVGFLGQGTNIGDALGLAVGRAAQSLAKNKIIILLTDGVSNVGSMTPLQAAEQAGDQGVKIYSIGIGGRVDAQIPAGRFGRGFVKIPGGSIDLKTLQQIAELTGAKSYIAQDEKALTDVLGEIEKIERSEIETSSKIVYEELYLKFLLAGILGLVFVEILRKIWLREAT
jgi:Ca-activated chloride channel homolog